MSDIPDRIDDDLSPQAYWRANLRLVGVLLSIWAAVSYGAGILFRDALDRFRIPGTDFPLGFWFAQQGSIYVFVLLILVYVVRMNRLDRRFGVGEGDDPMSGLPGDAGENPVADGPARGDPTGGGPR